MIRQRRGAHTSRGAAFAAISLAVALAVAACGSSVPTASPSPTHGATPSPAATPSASPTASPNLAAIYAGIEQQVEQLRGLTTARPFNPTILSTAELRTKMLQDVTSSESAADLARQQLLYQGLGLLPAGANLQQLQVDLLSGQVAGFYDPATKQLYVVSKTGSLGPAEKVTFAHEFDHALQDQAFGLAGFGTDTIGQGDRSIARLALVEGDATLLMAQWARIGLSLTDLLALSVQANDPTAIAQLKAMPAILRESELFPYVDGLAFVSRLYAQGGWQAVDQVWRHPPDSSSQILHPALYAAHVEPVAVKIPSGVPAALGSGWQVTLTDTMGEFALRLWLNPSAVNEMAGLTGGDSGAAGPASGDGATDWAGDRIELCQGPGGSWAIVLATSWRTGAAATRFSAAAAAAISSAHGLPHATVTTGSQGPIVLIASDAATLTRLEAAVR